MEDIKYGPLRFLIGTWESKGLTGENQAPDTDRKTENTKFRQMMTFGPIGDVKNHEQVLFVLRYHTKAWEEGKHGPNDKHFHEEVGYFIWDKAHRQVMKSFIVPRGVSVNAGGDADQDATEFKLSATLGSSVYGICSNKFLDEEFQSVRYDVKFEMIDENTFSYEENTQIKIKGQSRLFDHIEKNTLTRV
ncbi:MAG: heme-binding beta-barrel domain-containing protein [Bacteriovoracaceae bacterium]